MAVAAVGGMVRRTHARLLDERRRLARGGKQTDGEGREASL